MPKSGKLNSKSRRRPNTSVSGERQYQGIEYRGWTRTQPHSSFPDRELVSLDYITHTRVNPGAVTSQDSVFAINSAFDPDYSGTGHQPRDFDTWATIYAKYRVRRVLAEVEVRQRASHGISVCMVPSNSATSLTAADNPHELPRAVWMGVTGSSQPIAKAREAFDPAAILGMTKTEFLGDDSTAALVTASPSQVVYLHVFAMQVDGTTACDFEISLRLRMEIEFYDRKVLSPSALIAQCLRLARRGTEEENGEAPVMVAHPGSAAASPLPGLAALLRDALARDAVSSRK